MAAPPHPQREREVGRQGAVRPRVVVSRCLGFDAVRYNGKMLRSRFVDLLGDHVDFEPVCPEVEIGLGTPRAPIRVIRVEEDGRLLVQPSTGRDLTGAMESFAGGYLAPRVGSVDGFILKSRSPSCAIDDASVMAGAEEESPEVGAGPGLFAEAVLERFPWAAVEDEARLTHPELRHRFLVRLWAVARLRRVEKHGEVEGLEHFHARYRPLLETWDPEGAGELDGIVASPEGRPFPEVASDYRRQLGRVLVGAPEGGVPDRQELGFPIYPDGLAEPGMGA